MSEPPNPFTPEVVPTDDNQKLDEKIEQINELNQAINYNTCRAWGCYFFIAILLFLLMLLFLSWGDADEREVELIPPTQSTVRNNYYIVNPPERTPSMGPLVPASDTRLSQNLAQNADSALKLNQKLNYLDGNPQDPSLMPHKTGIINLEQYEKADSHLLLKGEWDGKNYDPNKTVDAPRE